MKKYPVFGDIAILVGVYLGASVVAALVGKIVSVAGGSSDLEVNLTYFVTMAGTLVMAIFFRNQRTGEKGVPRFKYTMRRSWIPGLAGALIVMTACTVVIEPLLALIHSDLYDMVMKTLKIGPWSFIAPVIMAPVLEELLFRGVLQTPATEKYGAILGILLSAAVFGVIHVVPEQVVNAFFIGLILGTVYYKTGSLTPVIILHFVNNLIAMISSGDDPQYTWEMIGSRPLYYMIYGAAVVIFVGGTVYMLRHLSRKKDELFPDAQ